MKQVGPTEELPQDADVALDMTGQIVLPGLSVGYRMRMLTLELWTAARRGGLAT